MMERGIYFCRMTTCLHRQTKLFSLSIFPKIERNICLNSLMQTNDKPHSVDDPSAKTFQESERHIWVGPAHPVSNLRLKIFPKSEKLTVAEKHFYNKCKETQDWNQQYWEEHNKDFENSKKSYIAKVSKEKNLKSNESLTVEEMSHFYKHFLDKNRKKHISYNWQWYQKNLRLLLLAAKAEISKIKKFMKRD